MSNATSQPFVGKVTFLSLLMCVLILSGCDKPDTDNDPPKDPPPVQSKPISNQSVVFNDPDKLLIPFSLRKTMDQVVATAGGASTTAALMLENMIDSFADDSFLHPVSGKSIPVTSRPLESAINAEDLLDPDTPDGMIPVGLFNRFDLAPADGSNCGEYRIVYAKKSSGGLDRMTMIFEAKVRNPNPDQGLAGCAPITDFWAERSNDTDSTQTVTALEKFYYEGLPGIEPVVRAENYGLPLGQLRVNLFKTPNPSQVKWVLREFLVNFNQNGQAIFKPEPIDDSPIAALFGDATELPDGFDVADQAEFRDSFLGQSLCNLVNPDRINDSVTPEDIINGISAAYDPKFNDFESISQDPTDEPAANTDEQLRGLVQTRLDSMNELSGVSSEQLMNRAGTMTCGGCHQFSANKDLGNGAVWPDSLGFVHIDEGGNLSPLLTDVFLPKRIQIAQSFKENRQAFHQSAAPCLGVAATTKSVITEDAKQARGHDLYENVDTVRNQMQQILQVPGEQSEKSEQLKALLPELKEATNMARQLDSAAQGAYTPRRSH